MTRDRLLEILAAYGADPQRWPDAERDAASALLAREPALSREAAALDALLALDAAPAAASDLLTARILKRAPQPAARRLAGPLAALAACALFGVAIGFGGGRAATSGLLAEAVFGAAFGPEDLAWIEDAG